MSRLFNPQETDDRSFTEQMADLGVEVVKKNLNEITGAKWARKYERKKPVKPFVTISRRQLYINVTATRMLNPAGKQFNIGAGNYGDQRVLLIRESAKGHKLSIYKQDSSTVAKSNSAGLAGWLLDHGLKPGRHELIAIKGGWMGVPE